MSARTFVDTNVLVYAFDAAEPDKREVAQQLLASAQPGELIVSAQVLHEFYVVTTRKLATPLPERTAGEVVRELARLEVVPIDAALSLAAVDRSQRTQLSLWDALIVEAARRAGCEHLLTEDLTGGQTIDEVAIVNPFV
jgi:predicted nucleic acid-binding protein